MEDLKYYVKNRDGTNIPIKFSTVSLILGKNTTSGTWLIDSSMIHSTGTVKYTYEHLGNSPIINNTQNIIINLGVIVDLSNNITVTDIEDGDLTHKISIDDSKVNYHQVGEYTVTYTVADSHGNVVAKSILLTILHPPDITAPDSSNISNNKNILFITGNNILSGILTLFMFTLFIIFLKKFIK